MPVSDIKPEGLEKYVKILEEEPLHNFGEARYHMINSGFVLAEVIRRGDPAQRTIGQVMVYYFVSLVVLVVTLAISPCLHQHTNYSTSFSPPTSFPRALVRPKPFNLPTTIRF